MAEIDEHKFKGDRAYVPGYLVERKISEMDYDVPQVASIDCCESEGCGGLRLWVDKSGTPMLQGSLDVGLNAQDMDVGQLFGRGFGIMRTWAVINGEPQDGFIIDLRYCEPADLERVDLSEPPDDTEDLSVWLDLVRNTIPVSAVIVAKEVLNSPKGTKAKSEEEDEPKVVDNFDIYGMKEFASAAGTLIDAVDESVKKAISEEVASSGLLKDRKWKAKDKKADSEEGDSRDRKKRIERLGARLIGMISHNWQR